MNERIISFDLGTGGNKASLYDVDGNCLATAFVPYDTHYPHVGWHEQCPEDWWDAVVKSTHMLLKKSGEDKENIRCLAISGHSLGAVPIDRNGNLALAGYTLNRFRQLHDGSRQRPRDQERQHCR